MKYKFSKYCRKITNGNKVVLANRQTGQWIRISKEVYDILDLGINNNLSIDELELNLYDDEDRRYIRELYKKLYWGGLICEEIEKIIPPNKLASIEITHKCNLRCIHCCINAGGEVEDDDIPTQKMIDILDKVIDWDPRSIMLSGGEPMIRKDFIEILTYLKSRYNGEITVSTNGTLINEENVKALVNCAYQIDISLDGVNEKTCSIVRGPGVFNKVIKSVQLLQSTGFKKITLSMTIGEKNECQEKAFVELNSSLGTTPIIRLFSSVGRGEKNYPLFFSSGLEKVYIPKDYLSENYNKVTPACSCSAGRQEIFITHNGDIYPCPAFMKSEYKLANIFDIDKISQLNDYSNKDIKPYEILMKINPATYIKCKNCKVNLFCWTCPGEIEKIRDNKKAFEDRCEKIKPVLYRRVWES